MGSFVMDLRVAVRGLVRSPGFTLVALATLALGIGANTAMFSLVYATLLRAPPVQDPDRLVAAFTTDRSGTGRSATSYPDFLDYRDRSTQLADLAGTSSLTASLAVEDGPSELVRVEMVTGNYFSLLGVPPASGRTLQPQDDVRGAGALVAVLEYEFWRERFGADPDVLGRSIRLNGATFEIVGIAAPDFTGMRLGAEPQVWVPLQSAAGLSTGPFPPNWDSRAYRLMGMSIGRLAPGSSVEQVRSELLAISHQLAEEDPNARGSRSVMIDELSRYQLPTDGEAQIERFVWLLLGVAGFTLLFACANLANLLLARASSRKREFGVRLAIGAGRGRLIRQLLTESAVLAIVGAGLGVLVAGVLIRLLARFRLPGDVSIASLRIDVDGRLLWISLATSLVTILVFGLAPALRATRSQLIHALRGDPFRGGGTGSDRTRRGLIAVQVSMCAVLLIGSGLFLRTIREGLAADLGVRTEGVALARFNPASLGYGPDEAAALADELRRRVGRLPGVDAVSVSTNVPLGEGIGLGTPATVEGYEPSLEEELRLDVVFVSSEYFESIGLSLEQGRGFEASDASGETTVVVSQAMADAYWPSGDAVGGSMSIRALPGGGIESARVIGVAANTTWDGLEDPITNYAFVPLRSSDGLAFRFPLTLAVHTTGDAQGLLAAIRAEIQGLEPDLPIQKLGTLEGEVSRILMPQRMGAALLSGFGLLALLLAAVGIVGIVSFSINQKRRDIGIRMALGARSAQVVGQLLGSIARPVGFGLLIGLAAARALSGTVESFMFRVDAGDPGTYGLVALGMAAVATFAALAPARRAIRISPVEVLKGD